MLIDVRNKKATVKIFKEDGEEEMISAMAALGLLVLEEITISFQKGHEALAYITLEEIKELLDCNKIYLKEV